MASIAGLDLELDQPCFHVGAAYRLTHPSREDFNWTDDTDTTEVVLRAGVAYVAVMVPFAQSDPDRIMAHTYDAAQRALDVASVQGLDDLALPDAHMGELLWWRDDSGVTLRLHGYVATTFGMRAKGMVRGADGKEVPQPPQPSRPWREAFRYYRLAQTTDDLYDAYRNNYLAFESILSELEPPQISSSGTPESEKKWLRRTFHIYAPYLTGTIPPNAPDPFQIFYDQVYRAKRCAMFHARRAMVTILPRSFDSRHEVEIALEQLAYVVSQLFSAHGAGRRQGGMVTYAGFELIMQGISSVFTLAVTDSPEQAAKNPDHHDVIFTDLSTMPITENSQPSFERVFLGTSPTSELQAPTVNAIVGRNTATNDILTVGAIDALQIEGVDTLEVAYTVRIRSRGMPNTRFQF